MLKESFFFLEGTEDLFPNLYHGIIRIFASGKKNFATHLTCFHSEEEVVLLSNTFFWRVYQIFSKMDSAVQRTLRSGEWCADDF